jgi:hypothetical protein
VIISPELSSRSNAEVKERLKGTNRNAPAVNPEVRRKSLLFIFFMIL